MYICHNFHFFKICRPLSVKTAPSPLIKIHQLVHKILSINKILISIKGHNSVKNERNIFFRGNLVMKIFLRPFSLFRRFKKSSCQLLAKECALSTGKLPRRLPRKNSVARVTDRAQNDLKCVEGP